MQRGLLRLRGVPGQACEGGFTLAEELGKLASTKTAPELSQGQAQQPRGSRRARRCRPAQAEHRPEFAEILALRGPGEYFLPAVGQPPGQLDLPFLDHVHELRRLTLVEEDFTLAEAYLGH